jgi:hypothetical protein
VYIKGFTTTKAKAEFQCRLCKHTWLTVASKQLYGQRGCPMCGRQRQAAALTLPESEFLARLKRVDSAIRLVGNYTNTSTKTMFKHSCGHTWVARPSSIIMDKTTCPKCSYATRVVGRQQHYEVSLGRKRVTICGFEPQALDWILTNTKIRRAHIQAQSQKTIPIFYYEHQKKTCRYFPDFMIKSKGIIVEVKSTSTLGLVPNLYRREPADIFARLKKKRQAVLNAGFKFNLLVMNRDGTRVMLPKEWYTMTLSQLRRLVVI